MTRWAVYGRFAGRWGLSYVAGCRDDAEMVAARSAENGFEAVRVQPVSARPPLPALGNNSPLFFGQVPEWPKGAAC